jgi:hypothetical protein
MCRVNGKKKNKTGSVRITYVEVLSCNHRCRGKAISITYSLSLSVCVCVGGGLVIQRAMRMHHIVICDLSDSTIVFLIS